MIINTNEVILADSEVSLLQTIIAARVSEISNDAPTSVKVRAQIGIFLNEVKMYASPTNALKVIGFENNVILFDYFVEVINGHFVLDLYVFDVKVKEHLMQCFPTWDETKLVITTTPIG